jgi:hypothetical protein
MPVNKEQQRKYQRKYQSTKEYKVYQSRYQEKYRASPEGKARCKADRAKRKERKRKSDLKVKGWTVGTFKKKLESQGGLCPIGKHSFSKKNPPCADHKHAYVPEPRGILCSVHNAALGSFHESTKELKAAIKYLEKYK